MSSFQEIRSCSLRLSLAPSLKDWVPNSAGLKHRKAVGLHQDNDIQAFSDLMPRPNGSLQIQGRDTSGWIIICASPIRCQSQEEIQDLHIQSDEFLIAEGAYGLVTWACINDYGECAIKWLRDEKRQESEARFEQEADLVECLVHPHIVTVKAAIYAPTCSLGTQHPAWALQGIVMEYVQGGTLAQRLDDLTRRGQRLNLRSRCQIVLSVARGLAYLHSQPHPIIHCDIKPENLLLDDSGAEPKVKIADFGLALAAPQGLIELHSHRGTPEYMAPEMIPEHGAITTEVTPAADLWSVGMLMFVLITHELPYSWTTEEGILEGLRAREPLYLPIPLCCEQSWYLLIRRCLQVNPEKRITAKQLVEELESLLEKV